MFKKIIVLFSVLLIVLLSSCKSTGLPSLTSYVTIDKLSIVNLSSSEIYDFKLIAPKSNTFLSAGYITRGRKVVMLVFKEYERGETGLLLVEYVIKGKKIKIPLELISPLSEKDRYDLVVELNDDTATASFE